MSGYQQSFGGEGKGSPYSSLPSPPPPPPPPPLPLLPPPTKPLWGSCTSPWLQLSQQGASHPHHPCSQLVPTATAAWMALATGWGWGGYDPKLGHAAPPGKTPARGNATLLWERYARGRST